MGNSKHPIRLTQELLKTLMLDFKYLPKSLLVFLRWAILTLVIGIIIGFVGVAFVYTIRKVTELRQDFPWILLGLPFGGMLIVFLYRITRNHGDRGTNTVIASLRSESTIPAKMAPLIFISTAITHLFGGSAGREGAALQIGGSIANLFGKAFRLNEADMRILILAGMSAAFSAIFRTPIAAVVFAMEVGFIGVMRYSALLPCTIASVTASFVAEKCGLGLTQYSVLNIPQFSPVSILQTLMLGILCAVLSIVFCILLHATEELIEHYIKNPYLRIAAAGIVILLLGLLFRSFDYFGVGDQVIRNAIAGKTVWYAFLAKMLFTAVTLGGGFKGGEIVPTFFIGATFGCLMGSILGLSPSLCAALGMIGMFCGVTNCPLASLLIAAELFGMQCIPFALIVIAVTFLLSGYQGLYKEQRFLYSKYKDEQIKE